MRTNIYFNKNDRRRFFEYQHDYCRGPSPYVRYDTELVQAKNVHAVITAQTKQIKSDYEIKLKQQEIVQEVGNANMLTKALIDRLINKVYVFPGDRIEIEYATQDFLETKESEKEV